jgi:hypothetical protein
LVTKGTTDGDAAVCDSDDGAFGWIGFEQTFAPNMPTDIDTAYEAGDDVTILSGPGCIVRGYGSGAIGKGDLVCPDDDGQVRKYYPNQTMSIPFEKKTSEFDSGYDLPTGAVITDIVVEVTTNVAASTIDVGILSTEASGDANGFIDGLSCATAGTIATINANTTTGNVTRGELISTKIKSADATPIYAAIPKTWVCDGTSKSVSYTTSDHNIEGYIHIMYNEPGYDNRVVGIAEETISSAGDIMIRSLI